MWYLLFAVVFILLFLDLKVFHRNPHKIEAKESLILTAFYIICSLLFAIYVWKALGESAAFDFLTGYFVEKSL
jgi:tellurite resistance protein TerC